MLAWGVIAATFLLARVALLAWLPPPEPHVHDEFGYLLAAEMFSHGHVAAPPLRHTLAFESPHVLYHPVYASIYQPGQGVVLAIGQVVFGHPYAGVLLSVAAFIFLLCWAARAWLPPQWTLIVGCTAAILLFVRHYWAESYWGGAVPACGGALVLGGLGYVLRRQWKPARFTLGVGAFILFFTRPLEGGVLCLGITGIILWRYWRAGSEDRSALLRKVLATNLAIALLTPAVAAWYNTSVTGSPAQMPYLLHHEQYAMVPPLWPLPPHAQKEYSNAGLSAIYNRDQRDYQLLRDLSWPKRIGVQLIRVALLNQMFQFGAFWLLLFALPWVSLQGRKHWLVLVLGLGLTILVMEVWVSPHYSAPFAAAELIAMAACARAIWHRLGRAPGRAWLLAPLLILLAAPLVIENAIALTQKADPRAGFIRSVASHAGKHLVFVTYAKGWDLDHEWVYNGFDFNARPVLFAHARSAAEDAEIEADYPDRSVWRVTLGPEPDAIHIVERPRLQSSTASVALP
jgi:hypothetical protein